jgi:hypothetical protein
VQKIWREAALFIGLLGSLLYAARTLSRSITGFERGFVLIQFGEDPSCGDELPRFFGAVSMRKTMMAGLTLATGPHLGRVQGRLGHWMGCVKGNEGRG